MNNFFKFKNILFFTLFFLVGFAHQANADTYMIPANTALVDETFSDCEFLSDGTVYSKGSTCRLYISIPGFASSTLTSVTLYYYDNSGSQYIYAYLKRQEMDSTSTATSLSTKSDTTTSSSIQTSTMTVSSSITGDYSYFVYVNLSSGTKLRGLKIIY